MTTPPRAGDAARSVSSLSRFPIPDLKIPTGVWKWGKVKIRSSLGNAHPKVRAAHELACRLPYDIMEGIIAHARDLDTLKACSLTCRSWYTAALPHIHRTLILGENRNGIPGGELEPISRLHELDVARFVKEIRVRQWGDGPDWFIPQAFTPDNLRYFFAFASVQTLAIHRLNIGCFIPGVENYFGQFSQTLRSITLLDSLCDTPQQLPYFLSLFPNLDNICIQGSFVPDTPVLDAPIPNVELIPFFTPKLRGQLVLREFSSTETWASLIAICGGLRFRHMILRGVGGCAPLLLEACAETLETLRLCVADERGFRPLPDLSRLKTLRSLEVVPWIAGFGLPSGRHTLIMQMFSTITSPVFFELVIVLWGAQVARLPSEAELFETLRMMYEARSFNLVFLIDGGYPTSSERQGVESVVVEKLSFLDPLPTIRIA